jgi:hypothetical protein
MSPIWKSDKLEPRGKMTNKKHEFNKRSQGALSTSAYGGLYEIHIKGQLDGSWSDWLEGMEVKLMDNGEMVLAGHIRDQAAMMGILNKLYSLNLTLLSLSEVNQAK